MAIIDLLRAAGADINQRMAQDEMVLHAVACRSSPRVIAHLLSRGADPMAVDAEAEGRRPVDDAPFSKAPEEIVALLEAAMEAQAR